MKLLRIRAFLVPPKMDFLCVNLLVFIVSLDSTVASPIIENTTSNTSLNTDVLSVNGQQLTEIPQGSSSIKILDLSYNHLSNLQANVFQNKSYKDITDLDLHENRIRNVSSLAFRGLRRLENLDVSFNQIADLDPYTFEQNRRIEKLDLTSNKIKFAKSKVFLMSSSMQTLILAKNDIDQLYELTFVGLKHLTSLILDDNLLDEINQNTFKPLNDIQFISLANTRVVHLGTAMFTRIPRVINVESTPLANKFDPPLTRIKKDQVTILLKADNY